MLCPRCHTENREGRRFCSKCAAALAVVCASCGFTNDPGDEFCGGCAQLLRTNTPMRPALPSPESYTPRHLAERILTSRTALEGERKQVTVLFADLKGSMELLADRDPEQARRLLDPVLTHMMDAVHRYEGTVNQVMGDGIMALFGAPLAHEDHAVRACYAALRMQEAVRHYADGVRRTEGVPIQIRVGLNSGEVAVRSIGSDLRMDYTAVGQTTHLAARMEQMATPGATLLTAETLRLAEGLIEVMPLGPMNVKGLPDPLDVYELTGAARMRSRLQAAAARGLTRFVGRDVEIEQLERSLESARTGRGQVVAVVGEPGVGKSRLFREVVGSHRTHNCLVVESGSVSYGKATSYLPVIDLLKDYFKIQDRDSWREMREKVTGKVLALDRALEPALPALLALLDVPLEDADWAALEPAQRRARTLDAVKRLLLRESREQPLVLVVEDLHWIDAETQAFLDGLVESLPAARVLLLVNYRPEYAHGWGGKTYYAQLRLDALPMENAGELLDALLGRDCALLPLKQLLAERTGGNPLFLEESVRGLVETGALAGERGAYRLTRAIETLEVPPSVQAILAARIDRLLPADKRLLQSAAVVGKDVPFALLCAIADGDEVELRAGLARLQAAEFLYETNLFPDLEYTFKHAHTHEVTYGGLLHERRRELHARIVDAIETLHRDRLDEHTERLAHHAIRGELREKAVRYLRHAGLKATARSALLDARTWFEQALGVLEALPATPSTLEQAYEIRLELWPALRQLGEIRRALERLREAEALAERLNDARRRGQACAFITSSHAMLGEVDEARASGARALEFARELGDLELRILTTTFLGQAHHYRGEYEQQVALLADNLSALPADWVYKNFGIGVPVSIHDRVQLVMTLPQLGRFTEAAVYEAELIRLAEPTHHPYTVGLALLAGGMLHLLKGDWAKGRSLAEHSAAALRTAEVLFLLSTAIASSAWALAQLGEASEALARLREAEQFLQREGTAIRGLRGWAYQSVGRTSLLLGRLDEAQSLANRAMESSPRQSGYTAHALHLLADLAVHPDRFEAETGEAHYREALALAEPRGMRPLIAHCHLGLGALYRRTGKRHQAQEHLTTATTMYREMGMTFYLMHAETTVRELA